MTPTPVEPELLEIFLQEAAGHLQTIRSHLPALGSGAPDAVQAVRRAAHTLKGSAAVVGLGALTRLAHRMEDLLDRMAEGFPSNPDIIDLIKRSADRLEDLAAGQEDATALQGLYTGYDALLGGAEAASAPAAAPEAPAAKQAAESFVRVPLRRLDEVVRLVSELMIARGAFEQHINACSEQIDELQRLSGDADDLMGRQARLLSEIHDRLMHIRLVPFGNVGARLRRTVRQVAERSGKPVDLVLEGESVEVDKALLEEMAEPLMHLLRNAVDHGIESPQRRLKAGKPERGRITVRAAHEGDRVVLRISDDGGGVDTVAVRLRAVERGFASPGMAARMTEAELFALVFEPGFSTAREVSETSGRGVGLDVVRECVERLKGSVTLTSRRGEGATFVVRLPMTVAVTRALLVRARGQTFAVPLASVAHVARLGAEAEETAQGTIRIGEDFYPRVALGEALCLRTPEAADAGRRSVLLVETGEGRTAVVVDDVQGGREIVVKNLGTHLRKVHGVSGATVTGDGGVVLILNPLEFTRPPGGTLSQLDEPPAPARPLSVLVVDDSPSMRRALTALVQREGWTAAEAKDGQEGLEMLAAGPAPDVMLVDVDMPRMNGFELLAAVKGEAALRGVPVVMVTSRSSPADRKKAEELGADGYVVKPYQDDELLATVRRAAR